MFMVFVFAILLMVFGLILRLPDFDKIMFFG